MAWVTVNMWEPSRCEDCSAHGVNVWSCHDSGHPGLTWEYEVAVTAGVGPVRQTWLELDGRPVEVIMVAAGDWDGELAT